MSLTDRGGDKLHRAIIYLQNHATEVVPFLKEQMKVPVGPPAEWVAARSRIWTQWPIGIASVPPLSWPVPPIWWKFSYGTRYGLRHRRLATAFVRCWPRPKRQLRRNCGPFGCARYWSSSARPMPERVLAEWAKGPIGGLLTREAAESLGRLKERQR